MPKKPKFNHPVRQVRTCLGRSQAAFAQLIGCSTVTVQRIENGSLELSAKLANTIAEATGAHPASLLSGPKGMALDMGGKEYSKTAFELYQRILPADDDELRYLASHLFQWCELMLIVSNRVNKVKVRAVFAELANLFKKTAENFRLIDSINSFLIENGHIEKRRYRVSDLRKFPEFARIIGYKDDKRFSPDKIVHYNRPRGWIPGYFIFEKAILPPDAEMKLRPNTDYIFDNDRPIPRALREIIDQALYWEITDFRLGYDFPFSTPSLISQTGNEGDSRQKH